MNKLSRSEFKNIVNVAKHYAKLEVGQDSVDPDLEIMEEVVKLIRNNTFAKVLFDSKLFEFKQKLQNDSNK